MDVALTISADGEDTVEVYRAHRRFSRSDNNAPVLSAEIDLAPWEGKLVRLDLSGQVRSRWFKSLLADHVGCSAEVVSAAGTRRVEFVGWQNDGSVRIHFGTLGSPAFVAPGTASEPLVYSPDGSLWHVLRVPQGAALRIALNPVPADSVGDAPKPFVPNTQPMKLPLRLSSESASGQHPDVFIYLIDALRADHLGCYGYSRDTSPSIDGFAAEATLYEQAQTTVTWTRPSVAALLTGLYPSVHGAVEKPDVLAEWPTLLSEALQEVGYKTCCVSTNGHVTAPFGFNQGFDTFVHKNLGLPRWANSQAARFLAAQSPDDPVFMYVHTVEPHSPYAPESESFRRFDRGFVGACDGSVRALTAARRLYPKLSADDIEYLIDLYDAEILDNDRGFGRFLELLKRTGRFENALIVLVADHGESFAEHDCLQHGRNLNKEELHVPLIIRFPRGRPAGPRVKERVSLVDLFPTILSQAGARPELAYALPGADLWVVASQPALYSSRRIYAELSHVTSNGLDLVGVIDEDGYKRVIDMSVSPGKIAAKKSLGLWDTRVDLPEQTDVVESLPARAAYDEQLIARWLVEQSNWRGVPAAGPPPSVEMTDEMRKGLRALGYLD